MDVTFTEEQEALRAAVADLLGDHCTSERVRKVMDSDTGADLELYRRLVEVGVTDLPGLVELGAVLEECGRAIAPVPLVSVAGIALPALEAAGLDDLVEAARSGDAIPVLAMEGEATLRGGAVSGVLHRVPEAHVASVIALLASDDHGPRLAVVDAADAAVEAQPTMDMTRRLCRVRLEGTPVLAQGPAGQGREAIEAAQLHGVTALAYELVGVAQACLDMAVTHAKTREQFGRQIGAYQAISHRCADMFVALESARSHAYYAGWAVQEGTPDAPLAASQAKAAAGDAAIACAQGAIQVHGGIGFTWEHDLHIYLRRARSGAALLGTPSHHRRRIADLMGV
ncbi:MAG: acyl-CoA dehydrogenase family protein [Egibacteraceae bacterium]